MKTNLTRKLTICLLSSSVFLVPQAFAVPQDVNGPVNCDADCTSEGVDFTANSILTVADGVNIGDTNQDGTGNSVTNSVAPPPASAGQINFLGSSTVSGVVSTVNPLDEILVQGTGTVAFQNNVTLGNPGLLFEANGTVSIADGKNFTGNIATNTDMQGNLVFLGASTVNGTVGGANALNSITTQGNVEIDTLTNNGGALHLNGNTLTVPGALSLVGSTINSGGDAQINLPGGGGAVITNATINVGNGTTTMRVDAPGEAVNITGSTINIGLGGASNGQLAFTNTAALTTDNTTTVNLSVDGSISDGSVINIITDGGGPIALPMLNGNNATYTFTLNDDGGGVNSDGDLKVTVARQSLSTTALAGGSASAGSAAVAGVLDQVAGSGAPSPLDSTINVIEQQTNAQVVETAFESLAPIQDSSTNQAVTQVTNTAISSISGRLGQSTSRAGAFVVGVQPDTYSAGDWDTGVGSWVHLFGTSIDQDRRDNVEGYDGWNAGFALGFDTQIAEDIRAGVGFSYAYTDLESKASTNNESDIQSYQGLIYGSYQVTPEIYWDAIGTIGYHDINTKRNIFVPGTATAPAVTVRADGEYSAWQFGAWTEVGYDWVWERVLVTPHINLRYSHTNYDALTERNAGPLGLAVNYDDVDEFVLGGGVYLGYYVEMDSEVSLIPNLTLQVYHDFINDSGQSASNFIGGGTTFATPGVEPAATSGRVGAGLDVVCADEWYLSLNYDLQFKSDFTAHGGWLRFRYEWS